MEVKARADFEPTAELELEVVLNAKNSSALTCMKAGGRVAEADGGLARLSVESEVTSQWTV